VDGTWRRQRAWAVAAVVALACTLSACQDRAANNYVFGKRHFVDESRHEHWVIDCRVGKTNVNGKDQLVFRHDEVSQRRYSAIHEGDAC
jgi:ABC-type uncharacterized transport system auxiliary subunit